jgi:hypothetical protein
MMPDIARDRAEADEPHALAGDLAADQLRLGEFARQHRRIGKIGAAQQHHGAADDIFDDGEAVRAGRRKDPDAAGGAGFHVDIVEADAEPADDLELAGGFEHRAAHLRLVAHDQGRDIGQQPCELVRLVEELGVVMDRIARAERRDRGLVHEFGDDDVCHRPSRRD